ncbi:AAA family ATPase [Pseudomonas sp. MDT1-16]
MTSALQDFQQFVHWIHDPAIGASEDARRFANVVLDNFVSVADTTRHRSQRSFLLADLARKSLLTINPAEPQIQPLQPGAGWQWKKLSHLTVGPFRGFRYPEPFDVQKRITMFYGPNGSGKTSLCEALEFALLGAVDESGIKRIAINRYLSNSHEGRYVPPILTATTIEGLSIPVVADPDAYKFCFVEKNRIDAFSRIAAKPAGEKTELIAALFGMDQFNELVGHFNETMDGQLTLLPAKQTELIGKRGALSQDLLAVANEAAALLQLAQNENAYADRFQAGMTYPMLLSSIGSHGIPGRLQELEALLNQPPPSVYGISSNGLVEAYRAADAAQAIVEASEKELANRSSDVSFQDLYNAVLGLQHIAGDHCPACDTPLTGEHHVTNDPYLKATAGLAALKELSIIQAGHAQALEKRRLASETLRVFLANFAQRVGATLESPTPVQRYLADPNVDLHRAWWVAGYQAEGGAKSFAQQAVDWAQNLEQQDAAARSAIADRERLIAERDRLNQARIDAATHAASRQQVIQIASAAKQRIDAFDQANEPLIRAAEKEVQEISRDTRINMGYNQFLTLLRQYRTELPGTLMAGLNALTLELYNEFNVRDADEDKLASLYLPVTGDGRIELSFRGKPDEWVDALQILSEGHVRCLGLAILLAKALSIRAPVIVFDDAINAIDHEHRQGIRETIFESERFMDTQIVVTCHSNEFIKDIQNRIGPEHWTAYAFRHHSGNYHPRVIGNVPPQTYLLNARAAVDRGDSRAALGASRQALEMLTDKIWRWLGKCEQGMLTLKLAGSGAEPALRNLCEGLLSKLNKSPNFVHIDKPAVVEALGFILGQPEQSLVWLYLNKGTHEEANREDFDDAIVEQVVIRLETLAMLKLKGR